MKEWSAIVRDFGDRPLSEITNRSVIEYKDRLVAAGRASATIKKKLAALHSLLEYAFERALIERNPATGVRV